MMAVMDLPQLYQRPSATELLATLADLAFAPLSWSAADGDKKGTGKRKVKSEGVPAYLTKIVANPLAWIADDAEKELIWETAAQRLSERSGRTGMGSISRTFEIPLHQPMNEKPSAANDDIPESLSITLYEPAMSEDNLGLKTWAASYLLAKRLPLLRHHITNLDSNMPILELGAGTGLVGLAAAAVFSHPVLLTDLPAILPNLERNVVGNSHTLTIHGGSAQAAVLDWSEPAALNCGNSSDPKRPHSFQVILSADPIYSPSHPKMLVDTIDRLLSRTAEARVVIELPLREAYRAERQDLKDRLILVGLDILEEGEESGFDDWVEHGRDELMKVRCWWGVWGWKTLPRDRHH
jgi:predicted nicotinamide N-methyase